MKIVWTRRASRHLRAAYEYWAAEKSEQSADAMLDRIFSTVELLRQNPELGRSGRVLPARELGLKPLPFLVVYRLRKNKIEIIALLHGARKWPTAFD